MGRMSLRANQRAFVPLEEKKNKKLFFHLIFNH